MDTGKDYILQCEKAGEIQALWLNGRHKIGDYYCLGKEIVLNCDIYDESGYPKNETIGVDKQNYSIGKGIKPIWLPRQDQLQDMLRSIYQEKHRNTLAYIRHGEGFINAVIVEEFDCYVYPRYEEIHPSITRRAYAEYKKYIWSFASMEQLWLAFVLREKYSKKWNGKEWKETK